MQITAARPADAARLTAIAFAAKRHWGYSESLIECWRGVLTITPEFILSHETFSAIVDEQCVGFYALSQKCAKLELIHMWVLPDRMGQGIGRSLFNHAVERARVLGFRTFEIESHPNAEGFYQRLGARRVGARIHSAEQQRRELPILIYELDPLADRVKSLYTRILDERSAGRGSVYRFLAYLLLALGLALCGLPYVLWSPPNPTTAMVALESRQSMYSVECLFLGSVLFLTGGLWILGSLVRCRFFARHSNGSRR